jgi:myo-inositol-1(or 4)-monophosphatase
MPEIRGDSATDLASADERRSLLDAASDAIDSAEATLEIAAGGEIRVMSWLSHDVKLEIDRLCEEAAIERIQQQYPDDSILSEESGLIRGTTNRTWVVDPLDGTVNFSHCFPFYAISVACVSCSPEELRLFWRTNVEAAAICIPPLEETFCAVRDGGATLNGSPLALAPAYELDKALICLGMSAKDGALPFTLRMAETFAKRAQKMRNLGAIAGELAFLAAGRLDALVQRGTNLWDFIGAALIVREAGGKIDAEEFAPGRWQVVAGNPGLFAQIEDLVRQA